MTQILIENGAVISLGALSKVEELNPFGRIHILPPPADGRCQVCGRHIRELEPFGGPGDPLVGDFNGELLVKKWRRKAPYDEAAEKAWEEARKEAEEVWKERGRNLFQRIPTRIFL